MDALTVLRTCSVLSDFDEAARARLAAAAAFRDYTAAEMIERFGHRVETVGIVVCGTVEVVFRSGRPPVLIRPGQIYGEISLLNGEPAIADVIARSTARVLHVPQAALTAEMARTPAAAGRLARLIALRLAHREEDPHEQEAVAVARREARIQRSGVAPLDGRPVLVVNAGSSSIKYALFSEGERRCAGLVERVGLPGTRIRHDGPGGRLERDLDAADHRRGLEAVLALLVDDAHGAIERLEEIAAVGHRTVHGGERFTEAVVVDGEVKKEMRRNEVLAPLHNPANLLGIELCEELLPGVPQVAVFDTAFHMTMPEHVWRYAIPRDLAERHRLRRYGFHGTSHKYVTRATGTFLGRRASELRIVTCHLGNGASVCAVDHGRSVDTSMGLTPLEGLVMGTRSGDVDPGLVLHLLHQGMSAADVDRLLNKQSGLLGLSGLSSDMRELEAAADAGHQPSILAIQAFCYRVRKYIGAYAAAMGGLDALVFTGGIGENGAGIRARICHGLGFLGITLDEERNRTRVPAGAAALEVSEAGAPVRVLVVPTDEEGMIVVETDHALQRAGVREVLSSRRDRPIPVGVSARHVHLTQEHVEALFGPGHALRFRSPLSQPDAFACEETVDLVGPKGRVDRVRVLGPVRKQTQVEIARTEEFRLGIDAPIRQSGDLAGTPGITLVGPAGTLRLSEGVICAQRHIHMSPEDALTYGLRDGDEVRVRLGGAGRSLVFGDVVVRVHPSFRLEMHLDTDEANAAEVDTGTVAIIDSVQHRRG